MMTIAAIHECAALAATTETAIYTVGASKWATISTIRVVNRTSTAVSLNLYATTSTGAAGTADWIMPTTVIPANDGYSMTEGLTLKATHQIRAYASAAGLTIAVFGVERST